MTAPASKAQPGAHEIFVRTSSSAHEENCDIDAAQLPCRDWVRIEGRYKDHWKTPMAGAEFRLWVNGALVLDGEALKDYADVGLTPGKTPATDAERKRLEEVGTFLYRNSDIGKARAEIIYDPDLEDEIENTTEEVKARLDSAYRELQTQMKPYQKEWDEHGFQSLQMAQDQGFIDAAEEFGADIAEMATAKYWEELGASVASALGKALDIADATLDKAALLAKEAYENRELLLEEAWWIARANEVVELGEEAVEKAEQIAAAAANAVGRTVAAAKAVFKHREKIIALPEHVVAGDINAIEDFIDTVLIEIDPDMAAELKYDKRWQGVIEMLHDGEAASIFVIYADLFLAAIPPNFWAYHAGKASFYIAIEILLILIGLLLGGAGAAARIASLSARLIRAGGAVGKVARMAQHGMKAVQAVKRMLDSFKDVWDLIGKLLKKLLRGRRRALSRGPTRSALRERRETEKRSGHCRLCGSTHHHTPLPHPGGDLDYD